MFHPLPSPSLEVPQYCLGLVLVSLERKLAHMATFENWGIKGPWGVAALLSKGILDPALLPMGFSNQVFLIPFQVSGTSSCWHKSSPNKNMPEA